MTEQYDDLVSQYAKLLQERDAKWQRHAYALVEAATRQGRLPNESNITEQERAIYIEEVKQVYTYLLSHPTPLIQQLELIESAWKRTQLRAREQQDAQTQTMKLDTPAPAVAVTPADRPEMDIYQNMVNPSQFMPWLKDFLVALIEPRPAELEGIPVAISIPMYIRPVLVKDLVNLEIPTDRAFDMQLFVGQKVLFIAHFQPQGNLLHVLFRGTDYTLDRFYMAMRERLEYAFPYNEPPQSPAEKTAKEMFPSPIITSLADLEPPIPPRDWAKSDWCIFFQWIQQIYGASQPDWKFWSARTGKAYTTIRKMYSHYINGDLQCPK